MISLYIHIPFCEKKCKYCNFFTVNFLDENFLEKYYNALLKQIDFWSTILVDKQIKTIYIWWGTPLVLCKQRLKNLIDYISSKFDLKYLEELTIELNPNPYEEVLNFIRYFNKKFFKFFRLRYSFGIQTFNDEILQKSFFIIILWISGIVPDKIDAKVE